MPYEESEGAKLRGDVVPPWMHEGKPSLIQEICWLHEQVLVLGKLVGELREEVNRLTHDTEALEISRALGAEIEASRTMAAPPLLRTATR